MHASRTWLALALFALGCTPPPSGQNDAKARDEATETAKPDAPAATGADASGSGAEATGGEPDPAPDPEILAEAVVPAPRLDESEAHPEPPPEPLPPPKVELDELGGAVFEALRQDDLDALARWTAGAPELAQLCPDLAPAGAQERKARFRHCAKTIDWTRVVDARVGVRGDERGIAEGCSAEVEELGRVTLRVKTDRATYDVEMLGAFGREGKAEGFSGALRCSERR